MRIKKLELIGFKSFKDRTVIQFDGGITGIVGPNGCGKSNIVDALMWVMGEMSAKDLRGSSMTDVIFAGAEGFAPLGMCEVSLTLENDGGPFPLKYARFSELMVTRKLYRSGEGEYFINKEPARLKDVQEIFMDTGAGSKGFSIIAQGMIGKIITSKPEDRKMLIEEAAGITKFKARKKESQRKLQSTDQNLVRLQDIIGELKRQIDSLQRQAQRAERYRNLKNQIEDLDLLIATNQFKDLRAIGDQAHQLVMELHSVDAQGSNDLGQLESELEILRLEILEQEKSVEDLQNGFYVRQGLTSKKELEIQELRFEIEQARRNEKMTGSLMQEQQARQELLTRDQEQLSVRSEEVLVQVDSLREEFTSKNEVYQNSQSRIQEIDEELTTTRRDLFAIMQTKTSLETKVQSLNSQKEDVEEKSTNEQLVLIELQNKKTEFEQRKQKTFEEFESEKQNLNLKTSELETSEGLKRQKQIEVESIKIDVDEFKNELNEVTSRLYGLEDLQSNFEGFQEGVKSVMLWQKAKLESTKIEQLHADGSVSITEQPVYMKPVSEMVEVPEKYEVAMEAALGNRLQILLAQGTELTLEAVDYLKEKKSGRSSFLTEENFNLHSKEASFKKSPENEPGVEAILGQVIQYSGHHEQVVKNLTEGVAVVDSVRSALKLRPLYPQWTFVTLEGDTLTSDGVLTGGSAEAADSGMLRRHREIKELTSKKNEWAGKLALSQTVLLKLENELKELTLAFEQAQKNKTEQEIKLAEKRKDFERSEYELSNAETAVSRQERECSKLQAQVLDLEKKVEDLQVHLDEALEKKENLEQISEELSSELDNIRLGFTDLQTEIMDLKGKLASKEQESHGLSKQLEMVNRSLEDLNSQISKMSGDAQMFSQQMTDSQITLEHKRIEFDRLVSEVEDYKQQLAEAQNLYEVQSENVREREDQVRKLQSVKNERQTKMNDALMKLEQTKLKEQYLVDQVREKYMFNIEDILMRFVDRVYDLQETEANLKD
ncbi:MAG TPA: chromosome segregation protein SMC, partial [Pseudobdellovibrionaceae bacterium]|nr:chromosome segregation protein SMC [Pseudobdellovibrionaceae bacterium]